MTGGKGSIYRLCLMEMLAVVVDEPYGFHSDYRYPSSSEYLVASASKEIQNVLSCSAN